MATSLQSSIEQPSTIVIDRNTSGLATLQEAAILRASQILNDIKARRFKERFSKRPIEKTRMNGTESFQGFFERFKAVAKFTSLTEREKVNYLISGLRRKLRARILRLLQSRTPSIESVTLEQLREIGIKHEHKEDHIARFAARHGYKRQSFNIDLLRCWQRFKQPPPFQKGSGYRLQAPSTRQLQTPSTTLKAPAVPHSLRILNRSLARSDQALQQRLDQKTQRQHRLQPSQSQRPSRTTATLTNNSDPHGVLRSPPAPSVNHDLCNQSPQPQSTSTQRILDHLSWFLM